MCLPQRFGKQVNQGLEGVEATYRTYAQDGLPVATYTGDTVEIFSTNVPKSTWFQVDGKMLFAYRADYTIIDNALLGN